MAKKNYEEDEDFATKARLATVTLQSGQDEEVSSRWRALVSISLKSFTQTYTRLNLTVDFSTWFKGESVYQADLPALFQEMHQLDVLHSPSSQTDLSLVSRQSSVVLRKADGSVGYDATDMAAIRSRLLDCDQILYVVDAGQALHFQKCFQLAKECGWCAKEEKDLCHVKFGLVCLEKMGKIKTREGNSPSLNALLDDASQAMRSRMYQCPTGLDEHLGVSSVVFQELKTNRIHNYDFSLERICNPDGDSALYLFYVLAKVQRHLGLASELSIHTHRPLAMAVCKFYDVVEHSVGTHSPHHLALYLLSISQLVSSALDNNQTHSIGKQVLLLPSVHNVLTCGMRLLGITQEKWSQESKDYFLYEKHRKRKTVDSK